VRALHLYGESSLVGDFCLRIRINSRIQEGLSGQARADTIIPSTTDSESTISAAAAFIQFSEATWNLSDLGRLPEQKSQTLPPNCSKRPLRR
jgi:hypothetical protein